MLKISKKLQTMTLYSGNNKQALKQAIRILYDKIYDDNKAKQPLIDEININTCIENKDAMQVGEITFYSSFDINFLKKQYCDTCRNVGGFNHNPRIKCDKCNLNNFLKFANKKLKMRGRVINEGIGDLNG
jgi:ribosomal protein S26